MAAQMPLHYPCTDVGGGTVSVQGGLLVAGTDGPGGPFIPDMDGPGGPIMEGTVSSMTDPRTRNNG